MIWIWLGPALYLIIGSIFWRRFAVMYLRHREEEKARYPHSQGGPLTDDDRTTAGAKAFFTIFIWPLPVGVSYFFRVMEWLTQSVSLETPDENARSLEAKIKQLQAQAKEFGLEYPEVDK